jgi:predicted O-methyltransferase YrrM
MKGILCLATVVFLGAAMAGGLFGESARTAEDARVQAVIDQVEKDCLTGPGYVYTIGHVKAKRLAELVREAKPRLVVECGTAVGYSGLWIARELKAASGGKLITMEIDPETAAKAKENFRKAGLSEFITLKIGDATKLVREIKEPIDFAFIDCNAENYLPCLKGMEENLVAGAVVVADNVGVSRGQARGYLEWVSTKHESHTEWFDADLPWAKRDAMEVTVIKKPGQAGAKNVPPKGFKALFSGEDLTGWYGLGHFDPRKLWAMSPEERGKKREADMGAFKAHWRAENGELVNDGNGPYATTEEEFGDVEFLIDYKTVALADSGIYLRATPQVQIWDYTEEGGKWNIGADKGSGGLWNNSDGAAGKDPIVLADKVFGEWNRFRILQLGSRTTVYLNEKLVVDNAIMENYWDRSRPLFAKGPIQLQTHGGEIRWRNIYLREVPAEEANRLLRGSDDGFTSVFNGKDFEGWAGPVENYEVKDGAIGCKENQGGTIYTQEEYTDFVVRFEFKLPPGGNNGLAIRYPGSGDTAYVGMCELQVLDDTARQYAGLDRRQVHGSAYGMAPAHRGYLRPTGQWNYQEVTVIGSTVKVELNGTVILDVDLDTVTEYMGNRAHPGKNRTSGHFGFAGHSDPVLFRNIAIKRLK